MRTPTTLDVKRERDEHLRETAVYRSHLSAVAARFLSAGMHHEGGLLLALEREVYVLTNDFVLLLGPVDDDAGGDEQPAPPESGKRCRHTWSKVAAGPAGRPLCEKCGAERSANGRQPAAATKADPRSLPLPGAGR